MNFGEALALLKKGKRVYRTGWNGKGMSVVLRSGYPDGLPASKSTAEAWGIERNSNFRLEPYFQIRMTNGSHAMWVPSINDCLAEDWCEEKTNNEIDTKEAEKILSILIDLFEESF